MPYQNDMSTLADVVGPGYAAMQEGIRNDVANQEAQAKATVAQNTVPALSAEPGLKNLFTQAQTGAEQGIAQQQQAKGQLEQAMLPSNISVGQAENQTKLTATQNAQLGQLGQIAGNIAGIMDAVPPERRQAAMLQYLQQRGVDPSKLPPEILSGDPTTLRNISQKMVRASADYQKMIGEKGIEQQTALGVAKTGEQGRLGAAEITSTARLEGQRLLAGVRQQQQTFEQAAVQAEKNGNHALAQQYAQAALQMKQAQANLSSQLVMGQPIVPPFAGGGGQGGQPQAQGGGAVNTDAVEQAAKNTFGAYEPDKYEYGVNPDTGNFARRPKQGK